MPQKLSVNNFVWMEDSSQFNEDFIKNYNEKNDEEYFLEFDVQYLQNLLELHNDLPFLPDKMKVEKVKSFIASLHNKTEYIIHIRNLKQSIK